MIASPSGELSPVNRASPRSRIFTTPAASIIKFEGLMSRCTIPPSWATASPCAAWIMASSAFAGDRTPRVLTSLLRLVPFHEFHDEKMRPAGIVGVDRADDVGVIQLRHRLGLSVEPLDELRVSREGRGQDLEGDHLLEPTMLGLEDHAHAAGAELIEHDIASDQEPLRLPLADRAGLIGRQSPRRRPARVRVAGYYTPLGPP